MRAEKKSKRQERREKIRQQEMRRRLLTIGLISIGAALLVFALLFVLPAAALLWMTSVPGRSHQGPLPPITEGEPLVV